MNHRLHAHQVHAALQASRAAEALLCTGCMRTESMQQCMQAAWAA
jgi:hypothetical protein